MVLGEGGGIDFPLKDHLWAPELVMTDKVDRAGDQVRETVNSVDVFEDRYNGWVDNISILRNYGLNAAVYTQISDVENEVNGWITYDRKVSKISVEKLAEIHSKFFKPLVKGRFIIPLSMNKPQEWQYSFSEPTNEWYKRGNSDKWIVGNAPFGKMVMDAPEVNTIWKTTSLYLQKEFSIKSIPSVLAVVTYNTGFTDIYINGEFAIQINNLKRNDSELKVSEVLLPEKALKLLKTGKNHLAVKFISAEKTFNYYDLGLKEY